MKTKTLEIECGFSVVSVFFSEFLCKLGFCLNDVIDDRSCYKNMLNLKKITLLWMKALNGIIWGYHLFWSPVPYPTVISRKINDLLVTAPTLFHNAIKNTFNQFLSHKAPHHDPLSRSEKIHFFHSKQNKSKINDRSH